MRLALALAKSALGSTSPNPAVGAVVVRDGEIVGEGATGPPGGDHAEASALKQAGGLARGADLYVTLEPCNHHGRSPPCVDAIIKAGIAAVHVGIRDPNPNVRGGGLELLRAEGIRTREGVEAGAVRLQCEAWLKFVETGRPFVTAKFAMSLDGKIAARSGDSKWISGERARWGVHRMRAAADAVMVGVGCALSDDPRLTARDERGAPLARQPLRVVVDTRGRLPTTAAMLSEPGETLIAVGPHAPQRAGAYALPLRGERVDLKSLLDCLAKERDVVSILVEGGGTLLGEMFDRALVDKVVVHVAPTIVGGAEAPTPVGGEGAATMAEALELRRVQWKRLGRDMAIIGYC